jgi:glycosyltransferase involved in cell wall biosynthesis
MPFVPKDEVVRYLSLMDVALVNLKKSDTFKTVIPSKIFEAAALQKPILLGLEGETKGIIESFNAGTSFEPENEKEFIAQCHAILDDQHYREYQTGCEKLAKAFDRKQIALQVLETITTD